MSEHGTSYSRRLRRKSSKSTSVDPSPVEPLTKNRRGALVDASAVSSATTRSRRAPRKVLDQDPNTPEGLAELHRRVRTLTTNDQVTDALSDLYVAVKGDFPPGVRDLENALKQHGAALRQLHAAVPVNAAANRRAPAVANLPSWKELGEYATAFAEPAEGDKPRPVADHLRQRIGELTNGKRQRLLARRLVGNKLTLVEVTEQNFQQVLAAFGNHRWTGLSAGDKATLETVANAWTPFDVDPVRHQQLLADWMAKTTVNRKEFKGYGEELSDASVKKMVSEALADILAWVEPEVLDAIGLPKIIVHGAKARTSPETYYSADEQAIHIQESKFTRERVRHEFGHHIEEQGPMEAWCGLAAYLQALVPDKALVDKLRYVAPQFGWDWDKGEPRLPNPLYALVYYGDASTELVSTGLEFSIPADPRKHVDWTDNRRETDVYDSGYVGLLMQTIRPNQVRAAGMTLPTLMQ